MAKYILLIKDNSMSIIKVHDKKTYQETILDVYTDDMKFDSDHEKDFEGCMKDFLFGLLIRKTQTPEN